MAGRDGTDAAGRAAALALALATVGFAVNFWAWALISPLAALYGDEFELSAFQQAFLVAVPVVVGSLGRVPVGVLTDRFGARVMFPTVSALTVVPVVFIGLLADSYPLLVAGGALLGLAGTAFAVGVPLVNHWFPPRHRGLALGVFGAGMGGTALSAFTTVHLAEAYGRSAPFLLVAVVLMVFAVVSALLLRDAPGRTAVRGPFLRRTWEAARLPATVQLSLLYAVGQGGFVSSSVYLPTYLGNAYGLDATDAALRTAGFIVLAVGARPVGGWLSDRAGPVLVLAVCFVAAALLACLAALELPLVPVGTVAFLGLALAFGASAGAAFGLVAMLAPPNRVGAVGGVVGAAGGLGGFVPPLVMGLVYGWLGDYTLALVMLAAVAALAAAFTWGPVRHHVDHTGAPGHREPTPAGRPPS